MSQWFAGGLVVVYWLAETTVDRLHGGSIRARREVRESEGVTFATKKNQGSLVPSPGTRRGEGGTPRKIGWGCAAYFPNPSPYLWPKSAIFPTLFMTCPKT